jgi:TRAP transporter TAXI family solute receptor
MSNNLTLALGSSSLTPLELTSAYAVFASGGYRTTPYFVTKVLDREGNVLEEVAEPQLPVFSAPSSAAIQVVEGFSLQSEVFTVLARRDARISRFDDLKGKRVNVGNPGSGQRDTLDEIMRVKGWDQSVFALSAELKAAEQASALSDNNIDVMTYFVGHPNGAIQEATATTDAVLVPVTDAEIDKLLAEKSYYTKAEIPGGVYKGNDAPTLSIGVKAVLSTTTSADPEVVYQLVKSVFDNLERFKRQHPAFADLKEAEMIKTGLTAPLHDGAVRYYKERGWL